MAPRSALVVTFDAGRVIQPIYSGGDVSIDSQGQYLATCLGDQVLVTDLRNGDLLVRIEGDGEAITAMAFAPNGAYIVLCSRSSAMATYSLQQGDITMEAVLDRTVKPFSAPVVALAIDRTSALLATGSSDGSIKVWDATGGYVTHTFRGHNGAVTALKFFQQNVNLVSQAQTKHGPGNLNLCLASGGADGKVRIWDLNKKKSRALLQSHISTICAIDFCPRTNVLVTASRDKTIAVWDARTWKPHKLIPTMEANESIGLLDDSRFIYSGGETGRIRIWDADIGHEITETQKVRPDTGAIISIHHCQASAFLLCVRADQTIEKYDLQSLSELGKQARIEPLPLLQRMSGTHDEIIDLAFVSADHSLMAIATNTEHLKLISLKMDNATQQTSGNHYFGADVALLEGHDDIIICLDVDWSGQWLATGAKDNTARLWFVDHTRNAFKCVATYRGHAGSLGAIALPQTIPPEDSTAFSDPASNPPKFLITGSQDQTVKKWSVSYTQETKTDDSQKRAVYTRKAHDKDINALAIDSDSSLFASASQDRLVKIWSTEEGQVQGILRGHKRGVWSVKFAPKRAPSIVGEAGSASSRRGMILTGSGDKSVKIWSLSDYSCLRTFEGHTNSVLKVVWFPPPADQASGGKRGHLVASAAGDGLVKVWDPQSGECVSTLDNHTERVWALATGPNLDQLVSGGGDGVITFWADTTTATLEHTAAKSTVRIEQEQELLNHIHLGHYRDAIALALQLNHPARLLALFSDVIKKHPAEAGSLSGVKAVDEVIAGLSEQQLFVLLLRLRDWNTNAKTAHVAQHILWVVLKTFPASKLSSLQKQNHGLKEVLNGLQAYTERHYRRTEELLEESYLIDFVLSQMGDEGFVEDEFLRSKVDA